MKARLEGGKVVKYAQLPETLNANGKHYVNFRSAGDTDLESAGFYDVVTPDYDPVTQVIHNLHLDSSYPAPTEQDADATRTVFTYDVKDKTISQTLAELKAQKIEELDAVQFDKLTPTDPYVWRKAEKGTAIPSAIQTERDQIRSTKDTKEAEINALTTKAAVLKYNVNF
jgi:hypothetical protein